MKGKEKICEKGITLIALVLTIIILLILAGVTISIVFNGGIINKSKTAVDSYHIQEDKEKIELAKTEVSFNNLGKIPVEELKETLIKYKFTICDEIKEFDGETLTEKQFVVKCPNKKHTYLVIAEKINIEETIPEIESISVENGEINLFDDITTTFTANITGKDYTVQWYYENEAIEGATDETYSIATTEMNEKTYLGGTYKCVVTYKEESIEKEVNQTVEYTISSAEQMSNFAKRVNNQGITFATLKEKGGEVSQIEDIDLSTVCGANVNGQEISWKPIGDHGTDTNLYFVGTFNGNNKTISNLYINDSSKDYQGLFGWATGNIKNIIVSGNITAKDAVGGIVGTLEGNATNVNDGIISNCTNYITINGKSYLGGIVGYKTYGKIENCINNGNIISDITQNTYYIGGITGVGQANSIINCTNNGNISGARYIGGISGVSNVEFCTISNCTNNGEVSGETVIAGIVGKLDGKINNCHNKGNITATVSKSNGDSPRCAGIVDTIIRNVIIEQCSNSGNITSINLDTTYGAQCKAGGIYVTDSVGGANIKKCYNTGEISTTNKGIASYGSLSGGIGVFAGSSTNQTIIENCYNMGILTSNLDNDGDYISGILGVAFNAKIINCYNGRNIISQNNAKTERISGITVINSNSTLIIENCYYLENTAPVGIDNRYGCVNISGQAEAKYAVYMKSSDFVNVLNSGGNNWKLVDGKNNNFPVLSWEEGTAVTREGYAEYSNLDSTGYDVYSYWGGGTETYAEFPT